VSGNTNADADTPRIEIMLRRKLSLPVACGLGCSQEALMLAWLTWLQKPSASAGGASHAWYLSGSKICLRKQGITIIKTVDVIVAAFCIKKCK
jgi:hypothetical protein